MIVTPKRLYEDRVAAIPSGDGVWMECEVTQPPSWAGRRTVHLYVPDELVTSMLLEFRDRARVLRAQPEART